METLPLEILHHIFLLACDDGGRTGISLSLVSRSYRDIARPVRYTSAALIGYTHIGTFLQCYRNDRAALQTTGQDSAPIVRHLLLTTDSSDIQCVLGRGSGALQNTLRQLFQLIGPNLVTLSYTCHAQLESLLEDCAFPRLEELTFLRNVPMPHRFNIMVQATHPYPQLPRALPSLRKLHVILITTLDHPVPDIFARWAQAAPNVTHLRVSNLRGGMGGMEWLQDMLDENRDVRPYPSLEHIVIQPYARPVQATYSGGMTQATHDQFVAQLEALQEAAPPDLNLVRLLPTGWLKMLFGEWQDGVAGGDGAWPEGRTSHGAAIRRTRTRRKSHS